MFTPQNLSKLKVSFIAASKALENIDNEKHCTISKTMRIYFLVVGLLARVDEYVAKLKIHFYVTRKFVKGMK